VVAGQVRGEGSNVEQEQGRYRQQPAPDCSRDACKELVISSSRIEAILPTIAVGIPDLPRTRYVSHVSSMSCVRYWKAFEISA
jgi:hypothetical protein